MTNERKKPKFLRQGANYKKMLKKVWRKPRGRDTKLGKKEKSKGKMPSIGYGAKREMRFKHPSGFYEVLVSNAADLERIDPKTQAARISGTVGGRKRSSIVEKAKGLKIKVLNA
ncbi:hypothetical protein A3K63_05575 [Candidatus Micrarchaeota archaeon RBG_16_49_10]|nr:MAG: hypothetical protein A3K63_05575 [Candidatus Micrarchaeota archaeon RBG_16_49_10]